MQSFLNDFLSCLHLTEDDRNSLQKKRGFHDLNIEKFSLKSCGLYIKQVINRFKEQDLVKNKIMDANGNVNPQLLRNNILIPYKDRTGRIEKIRPHKLGFKSDPVMVFSDFHFDRLESDTLVLTEGEFKAIAGFQYGLNIVAIPGIGTFCKNLFPDLLSFISNSKIKNIIIMFDREIKDNPEFENYKPDWKDRYYTEIYSYVMAKKLEESGFVTKIGEFPKEWMSKGKADFDSVLASGVSKSDLLTCMAGSIDADTYLKVIQSRLDPYHWEFVSKKIKHIGRKRNLIRWANKYFLPQEDDDTEIDRPISNFTIDILATYYDQATDQLKREIQFTNEFGEKSKPKIIDPSQMTSLNSFKNFCYSNGNFMYYGNEAMLLHIWENEFASDEGVMIQECDHIGKVEIPDSKDDVWIFKNIMFYNDTEVQPDDNGIFWHNNKGFKIKSLDGSSEASAISICQIPEIKTAELSLEEIKDNMVAISGNHAKMIIGWAAFSVLKPYLKEFNDVTPYPFLYGEKQTGKTTMCQVVMGLFGLPDFGTTFTDITKVAITRLMSYYSYIPLWIDEFSNDNRIQGYEPHLKSVYNKMPVIKGRREAFGVSSYPIRSGLIMSGETIPTMDAVKQRCVLLAMRINQSSSKNLKWLQRHKKDLSYFLYYVVKNRVQLAKKADHHIKKYYSAMEQLENVTDIRIPKHFSLFAGCFRAVFENPDAEFNNYLLSMIDKQAGFTSRDEVFQFFEDLFVLHADGEINKDYVKVEKINGKYCGIIWYGGTYDKWKERYSKFKEIHAKDSLKEVILSRDYVVTMQRLRINGAQKQCLIINLEEAPPTIKDFFVSISDDFTKSDIGDD